MTAILQKIDYVLKHNQLAYNFYRSFFSSFFKFVGLFVRTDKKLILFTGHGKRYNDSPRAIYLYLVEKGLDKKYHCVWSVDDPKKYDIPGMREVIVTDTWKYFVTALRAKYWCCCVNMERGLHFKKDTTKFLHTWHGASINLCGNSVGIRKDFDFGNVDFMCISGEYEREFVKRDFKVRDESIIVTGLPRNDRLYHSSREEIMSLRKKFNIPEGKKAILYAPTWRDSNDGGKHYSIVPPIDWKKWERELGNQYVLLLRTHPYTTEAMKVDFNDFLRDCTSYPDVNDLMLVSDILISDYSSTILDYCILDRPIVCFGYDYDEYARVRGFYYDLRTTLPSGVKKTEDEVLEYIRTANYEEECEKTRRFHLSHMEAGGDATKQCVEKLLDIQIV